jgi:hypothetical protein
MQNEHRTLIVNGAPIEKELVIHILKTAFFKFEANVMVAIGEYNSTTTTFFESRHFKQGLGDTSVILEKINSPFPLVEHIKDNAVEDFYCWKYEYVLPCSALHKNVAKLMTEFKQKIEYYDPNKEWAGGGGVFFVLVNRNRKFWVTNQKKVYVFGGSTLPKFKKTSNRTQVERKEMYVVQFSKNSNNMRVLGAYKLTNGIIGRPIISNRLFFV